MTRHPKLKECSLDELADYYARLNEQYQEFRAKAEETKSPFWWGLVRLIWIAGEKTAEEWTYKNRRMQDGYAPMTQSKMNLKNTPRLPEKPPPPPEIDTEVNIEANGMRDDFDDLPF